MLHEVDGYSGLWLGWFWSDRGGEPWPGGVVDENHLAKVQAGVGTSIRSQSTGDLAIEREGIKCLV